MSQSMHGPKRTIDLDCGIASSRISAWLEDEIALPQEKDCYVFKAGVHSCRIRIEPLESRTLGAVSLERTRFFAEGHEAAIEALEDLFTLRFMSAGG